MSIDPANSRNPAFSPELSAALACPVCRAGLSAAEDQLACDGCGRRYPVRDGIPVLLPGEARSADGAGTASPA